MMNKVSHRIAIHSNKMRVSIATTPLYAVLAKSVVQHPFKGNVFSDGILNTTKIRNSSTIRVSITTAVAAKLEEAIVKVFGIMADDVPACCCWRK